MRFGDVHVEKYRLKHEEKDVKVISSCTSVKEGMDIDFQSTEIGHLEKPSWPVFHAEKMLRVFVLHLCCIRPFRNLCLAFCTTTQNKISFIQHRFRISYRAFQKAIIISPSSARKHAINITSGWHCLSFGMWTFIYNPRTSLRRILTSRFQRGGSCFWLGYAKLTIGLEVWEFLSIHFDIKISYGYHEKRF